VWDQEGLDVPRGALLRVSCSALLALCHCRAAGGGELPYQEDLAAVINGIMQVTNVAFFGLAGASLKLVSCSFL
jgi:hypothetical protein